MARVTGLEPATSAVTGQHSNQLSYTRAPFFLGRALCLVKSCPVRQAVFTLSNAFYANKFKIRLGLFVRLRFGTNLERNFQTHHEGDSRYSAALTGRSAANGHNHSPAVL